MQQIEAPVGKVMGKISAAVRWVEKWHSDVALEVGEKNWM